MAMNHYERTYAISSRPVLETILNKGCIYGVFPVETKIERIFFN